MKKPLMMLICAGIVILAMFISIIVAHGKISSTQRKLSLCNDELNKVSQQLKELKAYTANQTFINPSETTTTSSTRYYYDDDDDDDDGYYNRNYTTKTTTSYKTTTTSSRTESDDSDDDYDDDVDYEDDEE